MDFSWFPFSIVATLFFGIQMALFKMPALKNISRFATTFWSLLTATLLGIIFFYPYLSFIDPKMILIAVIWGISFTLLSILQMHALKYVDTNILFPITTSASLVITIIYGITIFKESLSIIQVIGVLIIIAVIYLFLFKGIKFKYSKQIIIVGISIIAFSAFNKILLKVGVNEFNVKTFIIYQYLFAAIFALLLTSIFHKKQLLHQLTSKSFKYGTVIGIFNFSGGYMFLTALS